MRKIVGKGKLDKNIANGRVGTNCLDQLSKAVSMHMTVQFFNLF